MSANQKRGLVLSEFIGLSQHHSIKVGGRSSVKKLLFLLDEHTCSRCWWFKIWGKSLLAGDLALCYHQATMSFFDGLPSDKRRAYAILAGIIAATIPCYCAGIMAIQRSPGRATETPTVTSTSTIVSIEPLATATFTPIPTDTLTPTITMTPFVPPSKTSSPSITPSSTATETPFLYLNEYPHSHRV